MQSNNSLPEPTTNFKPGDSAEPAEGHRSWLRLTMVGVTTGIVVIVALIATNFAVVAGNTRVGWIRFPYSGDSLECAGPAYYLLNRTFGRPVLYALVADAAARVAGRYPGSKLYYLDGSMYDGRPCGHISHRRGVDLDLTFYFTDLLDRDKRGLKPPTPICRGMHFDDRGRWRHYRFDADRNWEFVKGLMESRRGTVELVFIEPHLKRILLEYARGSGESASMLNRAEEVLRFAGPEAGPHDDHFHVRLRG